MRRPKVCRHARMLLMQLRAATIAALIVLTGLLGTAAPAQASPPRFDHSCSPNEAGNLRYTPSGRAAVCAYLGSGGYRWVRTGAVDPVVRAKGQRCSGVYSVARTRQGKAVMCSMGRWIYGP